MSESPREASLRAQRDNLYWFFMMIEQSGPDGSELDLQVLGDARWTATSIRREKEAEWSALDDVPHDRR